MELQLNLSQPNAKQKEFFEDRHRYIAFGGARGGGKSWAVRTKAIMLALRYPGIRMLIVRRTYRELENNHIRELVRMTGGIAEYNAGEKILTFSNSSTVTFAYCAKDADLDRLQGVEFDVIFIDEATQLSEYQCRALAACIRGVNAFPKRMYLTCNPGGQGHGYIKRLFIDKRYNTGENPDDYSFIRSLATDNTALMRTQPEYISQLKALPARLRTAWLEGDWNINEGQFFEDFIDDPAHYGDRKWTHVIDPFDVSRCNMTFWRSYDFGYNRPFSCGWWAVSGDGTVYRILELYGCTGDPNVGVRWDVDRQFAEIKRIETEHPWLRGKRVRGVADPSIWDASRGESVAEAAMRHGVYFEPGDNKRIAGWTQCHYRLAFDERGFAQMYVFSNCKAFRRTVPLLEISASNPEDLDTSGEDHVADEWRYFMMTRPIGPRTSAKKSTVISPLDM